MPTTFDGVLLDQGGAVHNVMSAAYGAKGDGVTDDTAAFQAAVNALGPWDVVLVPPPPVAYKLGGTVSLSGKDRIAIVAAHGPDSGPYNSLIQYTGTGTLFDGFNSAFNRVSVLIKGISFQGPGSAGIAVRLNSQRARIVDCSFVNFAVGLRLSDAGANLVECYVQSCIFQNNASWNIQADGTLTTDGFITDCIIADSFVGVEIQNANGWHIHGCHFYGLTTAVKLNSGTIFRIEDNYFEVDRAGGNTVGVRATLDSSVEAALIAGNIFTTVTPDAIMVRLNANTTTRVLVTGNHFFATAGTSNVTAIFKEGIATLFGTAALNNHKNMTNILRGTDAAFEFLHFFGDQLRTQVNQLWLANWSAEPTKILTGSGSPEGVVAAGVGSIFLRRDGGSNSTLYVKQSGTGATGWAAK